MLNGSKIRLYLGILSVFAISFIGLGYVNAISFTERLGEIGLDANTFSNKKSVSRYEIARLLNAANCEDCIQAPDWMKQAYTQAFWDKFKIIDGKDFNDINYGAAVWNKKSYYYCVAYVGDNGYMAGYPLTSTKCQGNFCGQDAITVSEVYQTVLNIIQDQIRTKYDINWSNVKSWMKGLSKDKRNTILNQTNIDAINNANAKLTYAQNNDEFQAWLKYCMYNLSGCNFQTFGKIGQAYWPISELNILYKEGMITAEDAEKVYTSTSINGKDALRIFGAVFDTFSSCSFNVDYDCDGITNGKDNCPYAYNVNQYDLDDDGIGNVCDDDIDGDGKKNPVGVVDDNNHVVISVRDGGLDETPLGDGELGFSFFINVEAITTGSPVIVRFNSLSSEDVESIERDFGDGTKSVVSNGAKTSHVYQSNGMFIIKAIAKSKKGGKSFAMTRIFVAAPKSEEYALNMSSNVTLKNGKVEYTLTPLYSGDIDSIRWSVNNGEEVSQKVSEKYKAVISENGVYVINAKGYKNGELKAVSMVSLIKNGSPSYANMTIKIGNLWEETTVMTNIVGINRSDIENISINRGGEITNSTNLTQKYVYNEAGLKTVQQTVKLKDGTEYYAISTVSIKNPLLDQSYAMNVNGKRLSYNQNDKLALGLTMYPSTPVLSLFTSYQAGQKQFLSSPNLGQTVLNFSYATAGDKTLTNSVEVNKCIALINQGTVHIKSVDICEIALKNNTLSKYKCDQDKDGIPDICDDDIDGDGIKNLIGIITRENNDCSISTDNINVDVFKQQFGVCSLDDCPFVSNVDQADLNNNGIGEICESTMLNLLNSSHISSKGSDVALTLDRDQDQDGIPDSRDNCVNIPGNSANGCPEYYNQNCWVYSTCGNGTIEAGETCLNCPQDVGMCCGNGRLDSWETCDTCPADAGVCELCGNGEVDDGENCISCPQDVKQCTAICGNGKVEDGETCENCPADVGKCTATCGNGKVEVAEDCDSCSKDVKQCKEEICGNGVVNMNEECDSGKDNGKDGKCTLKCTKYDPSNPKCGNGEIDEGEDCVTCPVDLGYRCVKDGEFEKCGNGEIDEGETCKTCPKDLGPCTAFCGDGTIQDAETCKNCPADVGKCTATCGNGKVEVAEDCDNCPKDVKQCKEEICGNGVVDTNEECDSGKDNGKDGKCTLKCTKYNPSNPKCGNGEIDEGEDCVTCPVDLGGKCVKDGRFDTCGNGEFDEGETCLNCPKDLGPCTAFCGDGIIQDAETCENCPADVGKCTATCGNGKVEVAEDCDSCSKDVKQCKSELCGNGVVDANEECDEGKNNGKGECMVMCVKKKSDNPNYGNGEIDEGENCQNASVDLGEKCVEKGDYKDSCGDGVIQEGENCRNCPADVGKCTATCGNGKVEVAEDCDSCSKDVKQCKSELCGNGVVDANEECDEGKNNGKGECMVMCVKKKSDNPNYGNGEIDEGENCQNASVDLGEKCVKDGDNDDCGNLRTEAGENCTNCSKDLKDPCVVDWKDTCGNGKKDKGETCKTCSQDLDNCNPCGNGLVDDGENCTNCSKDVKDPCVDDWKDKCGNGEIDKGENCTNCSKDLKERCIEKGGDVDIPDEIEQTCGNGAQDQGEDCGNCPEDIGWCVENNNCNTCPCEYVDFSTDLTKGDSIRAKLWDKPNFVFYRYSNTVSVENYLDLK